jgi:nucleoside 2-deoxyribosyltransferase
MQYKPPQLIPPKGNQKAIFLAGTIDMGNSEDWQSRVANRLNSNIVIYNPRRDDWDSTLLQSYETPQFNQQVNWELNALNKADVIIFNFLPDSKSPITLLELGLYAASGKAVVCCPDEYYKAGNVHIICERYDIPLYKDMDCLLKSDKVKKL